MMGRAGLRKASQIAILNANYMSRRLAGHFKTLYKNEKGKFAIIYLIHRDFIYIDHQSMHLYDCGTNMNDYFYKETK